MTERRPDPAERRGPVHRPVMLRETLRLLELEQGQAVVDGTVGAGGHSRKILEEIGETGTLIGIDRDPMMLDLASQVLASDNCRLVHANHSEIRDVLDRLQLEAVDRVLLDLGLSSDQLSEKSRGFSFDSTGPLDLRFDPNTGRLASEIIEESTTEQLETLFREYGEERFSRRIAEELVARRRTDPVATPVDLVDAVQRALPAGVVSKSRKNPASRVFQALRIAVNEELRHVERTLEDGLHACLKQGGRAVVITFHSIEDRLVKNEFRKKDQWRNLTSTPVTPRAAEIRVNPRSRSAKLRAAIRR